MFYGDQHALQLLDGRANFCEAPDRILLLLACRQRGFSVPGLGDFVPAIQFQPASINGQPVDFVGGAHVEFQLTPGA